MLEFRVLFNTLTFYCHVSISYFTCKLLHDIFQGKPPVLEAFLDLKQLVSSEKDSDTDFSSDSLQQQPKVQ